MKVFWTQNDIEDPLLTLDVDDKFLGLHLETLFCAWANLTDPLSRVPQVQVSNTNCTVIVRVRTKPLQKKRKCGSIFLNHITLQCSKYKAEKQCDWYNNFVVFDNKSLTRHWRQSSDKWNNKGKCAVRKINDLPPSDKRYPK